MVIIQLNFNENLLDILRLFCNEQFKDNSSELSCLFTKYIFIGNFELFSPGSSKEKHIILNLILLLLLLISKLLICLKITLVLIKPCSGSGGTISSVILSVVWITSVVSISVVRIHVVSLSDVILVIFKIISSSLFFIRLLLIVI